MNKEPSSLPLTFGLCRSPYLVLQAMIAFLSLFSDFPFQRPFQPSFHCHLNLYLLREADIVWGRSLSPRVP